MRCPHCLTLGYPDRSGRYLLPLTWECPSCGAANDGSANFCLACGAGLATRCLRCEYPVYTVVCDRCGAHQSHLAHYREVEARRETWVPIVQQQISQQRARDELEANRHVDPTYGVAEWRTIDTQMRAAVEQRQQKFASRRAVKNTKRRVFWGWVWLLIGAAWLIGANYDELAPLVQEWVRSAQPAAWVEQAWSLLPPGAASFLTGNWAWLQSWWVSFQASLSEPAQPSDLEYAYLFATVVFGVAMLPILFFLLGKIVRRLFP
jgi:hypothetical protein